MYSNIFCFINKITQKDAKTDLLIKTNHLNWETYTT